MLFRARGLRTNMACLALLYLLPQSRGGLTKSHYRLRLAVVRWRLGENWP